MQDGYGVAAAEMNHSGQSSPSSLLGAWGVG